MLPQYQRTTNIGIGIGLVLAVAGKYLAKTQPGALGVLGYAMCIVAMGFFVWGSAQYAKGKGHSPYWGAFGILYLLGFVVLVFLPDRHKPAGK
jgi:TRAP-type C4-dicarboxylate transport system permease small subunit